MACGRSKNLEIEALNPLCGPLDRRRNSLTTRDGNRRRGNPEPPGKGQLRAFGQGEARRHRCGGNPGPPGIGQALGPLVPGKARCQPARGKPARGNSGPPGSGKTFKARGKGETPSYVRRRKLWATAKGRLFRLRWRGNPESRAGRKALSHPAKGRLEPFGLGETPVIWRKESSEPPAKDVLGATRLGGNPGLLAMRKA